MSSGLGRGRGWLNLAKNSQNPGGVPSTMNSLSFHFSTVEVQQYAKLVQLIEELDSKDDGILLNEKFKVILQRWKADTNSSSEVKESFKYVYAHCRKSFSSAKKLVRMLSAHSFKTVEICDVRIRRLFINYIQNDFNNRIRMQTVLPDEFRNSLYMLIQFYIKVNLADGQSPKVLAIPTVQYLDMLLDSGSPTDLELFTTQLFLSHGNLREHCKEKVDELLLRVRQCLTKNTNWTSTSRTWLLLVLDLINNRRAIYTTCLFEFYREELGDAIVDVIEEQHDAMQLDISPIIEAMKNSDIMDRALSIGNPASNVTITQQQQFDSDVVNQESAELAISSDNREKIGRPILGVGARLQKHTESTTNNWKNQRSAKAADWESGEDRVHSSILNSTRDNTSFAAIRNNEQSRGYGNVPIHNKGWEHDDRFDINYD